MLNADAVVSLDNMPLRRSSQCTYRGGPADEYKWSHKLSSRTMLLQTSGRLSEFGFK